MKTNLKTREHELSSQIVWTFVIMIRNTEIILTWVPNNLLENGSATVVHSREEVKRRRRVEFDAEICLMAPITHWAILDL